MEIAGHDPIEGQRFIVRQLHVAALQGSPNRIGKCGRGKGQGHELDDGFRKTPSEKAIDGRAGQRQQWNDPEIEIFGHNFSKFTRSTLSVSRVRKTAMMMAKPTVASAAATTITKNTNTWPFKLRQWFAKATKLRFTALSISSMDMKMVMMFRLSKKAETPKQNRMALRIRYQESGTMSASPYGQHDRAHDGDQYQH